MSFLSLLLSSSGLLAQRVRKENNRVVHTEPCVQSSELRKHDHMDLGVWLNTSNPSLATEFRHAMDFWAAVLDMTWHETNTTPCSIQVIDGGSALFTNETMAARSQFADRANFHGWIAFNPRCRLSVGEMYLASIHELGHMLGLEHNPNPKSIMYFMDPEEPPMLDSRDLGYLSKRHRLRKNSAALLSSVTASPSP